MSPPSHTNLADGIISVISRIDMVYYTCCSPGEVLIPSPSHLSSEHNPSGGLLQDVPMEPFVPSQYHTHTPKLELFGYECVPCWEYKQINEVGHVSAFYDLQHKGDAL